jgi:hypothetical protein
VRYGNFDFWTWHFDLAIAHDILGIFERELYFWMGLDESYLEIGSISKNSKFHFGVN